MKKITLVLIALGTLMTITSTFAQVRGERRGPVVRIEVGDERDERDMLRRIHRLERAVRDLQDQVFQLQTAPRTITRHVCSGTAFSAGAVIGRGATRGEAITSALADCARRASSIFCEDESDIRNLRCEITEERI